MMPRQDGIILRLFGVDGSPSGMLRLQSRRHGALRLVGYDECGGLVFDGIIGIDDLRRSLELLYPEEDAP